MSVHPRCGQTADMSHITHIYIYIYIYMYLVTFANPVRVFLSVCSSNVVSRLHVTFLLRLHRKLFFTFANMFLGFATFFLCLQALEVVPSLSAGAGSKSLFHQTRTLKSAVSLSSGSPGCQNSRFAQLGWPDFRRLTA